MELGTEQLTKTIDHTQHKKGLDVITEPLSFESRQRLKLEQKGLGSDSVFRDNINQSFPSGKGYPFCKTFDPGEFVRSHSHRRAGIRLHKQAGLTMTEARILEVEKVIKGLAFYSNIS